MAAPGLKASTSGDERHSDLTRGPAYYTRIVGYENCGAAERYPYDQLFDGRPHLIRADGENSLRALRYGAKRRGMRFTQKKVGEDRYEITAVKRVAA